MIKLTAIITSLESEYSRDTNATYKIVQTDNCRYFIIENSLFHCPISFVVQYFANFPFKIYSLHIARV